MMTWCSQKQYQVRVKKRRGEASTVDLVGKSVTKEK